MMRFLLLKFCKLLTVPSVRRGITGLVFLLSAMQSRAEPSPQVSLSLRGVAEQTVEIGEPIFVAVRLDHPDESEERLELAPATGKWSDGVQVEIVDDAGKSLAGRLLSASGDKHVVLAPDNPVEGIWYFPLETVSLLKPGSYTVKARMRVSDGVGWRGERVSSPLALTIGGRSSDPLRRVQHVLALANAARAEGSPDKAARLMDDVLAENSDQIQLLAARADLALSVGNSRVAFLCLTRASALASKIPGKASITLNALWERVALAGATTPPANLPAWSDLPPDLGSLLQRQQ